MISKQFQEEIAVQLKKKCKKFLFNSLIKKSKFNLQEENEIRIKILSEKNKNLEDQVKSLKFKLEQEKVINHSLKIYFLSSKLESYKKSRRR